MLWKVLVAVLVLMLSPAILAEKKREKLADKAMDTKGVLSIDSITFEKMIPSDRFSLVLLIYQKSRVGDYGTDSIRSDYYAFAKKAQTDGESSNVLFGQMIVNGADNGKLAKRLGASDDFNHPFMVVVPRGSKKAVKYTENLPFRLYELTTFVSKHTDLFLAQAGRTKLLNQARKEFLELEGTERASMIAGNIVAANLIENSIEKEDALYHLGILEKIHSQGKVALEEAMLEAREHMDKPSASTGEKRVYSLRFDVLGDLLESYEKKESARSDL